MLKIITDPNPILRKKSLPVADILSPKIQKLAKEMMETLLASEDGVGLAAPQVGQNVRVIVIRHKDADLVVINPKIVKRSILKEWGEEGCLSVPGKYGEVKRNKQITVKFFNELGQEKVVEAKGLLAIIFQHEIDHLDGILFTDKARNIRDINYE